MNASAALSLIVTNLLVKTVATLIEEISEQSIQESHQPEQKVPAAETVKQDALLKRKEKIALKKEAERRRKRE